MNFRIGQGYDVHRLILGHPLIIGGVNIPFERGLLGHSDADVLLHAVIDSLFGAACLGDIGRHFPDTDPAYRGADSICLLREAGKILYRSGWAVINIDSTIVAQAPKMAPYIERMRNNIANALSLLPCFVSVKAKSEEGLGFTGNGEGIAAQAIALIELKK